MKDHKVMWLNATEELRETGRWALSVACAPGLDRDALVEAAGLRSKSYCASDVETIREASFDVEPDETPHALLMLGPAPDEVPESWLVNAALWDAVRVLFHGPYPNPGYAGGQP